MIRRDDNGDWLLISQVEHARVAGELAAAWGNADVPALPVPEFLIPAIHHHDDGWEMWECSPTVDPATGKPRDFTEMPMTVATGIWNESISHFGSASGGALSSLWVSRHFCWLAERAQENRKDEPNELAAIGQFLRVQAKQQERWKETARREFSEPNLDELIETGFRYVQFFDRISLWLCCAQRTQPFEIDNPGGGKITLIPHHLNRFVVEPWPLADNSLVLSISARPIPARTYSSDVELRMARATPRREKIIWTLVRSDASGERWA